MIKRHLIAAGVASTFPLIGVVTMSAATAVYGAVASMTHRLHTHR